MMLVRSDMKLSNLSFRFFGASLSTKVCLLFLCTMTTREMRCFPPGPLLPFELVFSRKLEESEFVASVESVPQSSWVKLLLEDDGLESWSTVVSCVPFKDPLEAAASSSAARLRSRRYS
jgi:hypothetical protein